MPRAQQMNMRQLQWMVDEAIDFIREHEDPSGFINHNSGGKDSICVEWLLRQSGVKYQSVYSAALDPPELRHFLRKHYPETILKYPKKSFYEEIQTRNPPLRTQRWCCTSMKKKPGTGLGKHYVFGIRAEESPIRAGRPRVDWNKTYRHWEYKPIFHWLEWHVWELIESRNLPYCELYDQGFHRLGCVVCPNHSYRQKMLNKARWPGYFKAFEHSVTRWFVNKRSGHDKDFETAQEYIEAWYRGSFDTSHTASTPTPDLKQMTIDSKPSVAKDLEDKTSKRGTEVIPTSHGKV